MKKFIVKLKSDDSVIGTFDTKVEASEFVTEECYRITDQEAGETGFYNADGYLIESRPATADEMQGNLFKLVRKPESENKRQAIAN